ncbi:MAG: AMP-binding protein [Bacteroidetes bacterium]|nr:AMP-binding protein [Bacteroidota bacterium]
MEKSLNKLFEKCFQEHWTYPALSNYKGETLHYRDVARRIEKLHIVFEECGLKKGDKVAICGRNQANWAVIYLATLTYGAVIVPILHEFKESSIQHIVVHSESRILFAGDQMWEGLSEAEMPNLEAVILIRDFEISYAKDPFFLEVREHLNEKFGHKYPRSFTAEHLNYHLDQPDELAMINYTSGTTGFSKGVMVPYRSLYSNVLFAKSVIPELTTGEHVVSMLPMAHAYGMMFEFIYEMTVGAQVHFLTRMPTPKIIMEAFADVRPKIIIAVPLIIEKIYKNTLQPMLNKMSMRVLLRLPVIEQKIRSKIHDSLIKVFGGNFVEVIIGGAPFNREAEEFFKKVGFPYTVGYGMTECGPIITYAPWRNNKTFSCGYAAPRMEVRIDSPDPQNLPGELQTKGDNVMLGYYKDPDATAAAFTPDGWLKTGDMATMDSEGFVFMKGRSKNMILGPSGQNIYPEEIESVLDNLPFVTESLVVEKEGKLIAIVFPNFELAAEKQINDQQLKDIMNENLRLLNEEQPNYAKVSKIQIFPEEFEKTPKKSIKRYLYQNN